MTHMEISTSSQAAPAIHPAGAARASSHNGEPSAIHRTRRAVGTTAGTTVESTVGAISGAPPPVASGNQYNRPRSALQSPPQASSGCDGEAPVLPLHVLHPE